MKRVAARFAPTGVAPVAFGLRRGGHDNAPRTSAGALRDRPGYLAIPAVTRRRETTAARGH